MTDQEKEIRHDEREKCLAACRRARGKKKLFRNPHKAFSGGADECIRRIKARYRLEKEAEEAEEGE